MDGMSRQSSLRTPIILLALFNLAVLGIRLWPWQNAMSLPGNGTTGLDPAIALAAYVGLGFWIDSARQESSRKALQSAALMGLLAGLFLVGQVVVDARQSAADPAAAPGQLQLGLVVAAAFVLGTVGLRTARAGFAAGFSAVCAIWASMVACLMAVSAVLAETYLGPGQGESSDPWKDYQGLAIGTPAMQSLVHSLNTIAGFLLIGPILGAIAGALFAAFTKSKKA
jgi:hypothetical protein